MVSVNVTKPVGTAAVLIFVTLAIRVIVTGIAGGTLEKLELSAVAVCADVMLAAVNAVVLNV